MKIGDYVRTNSGWICKLDYYDEKEKRWITHDENDWYPVYESQVKISSPNIIDLIEIGDYVNGKKVGFINDSDYYDDIFLSESWDKPFETMIVANYKYITSIVTKEQFEAMKYKLESEVN